MSRLFIFIFAISFFACSDKDEPNLDLPGQTTDIWIPEKSQPGIFSVPDGLKNNPNVHAQQTFEGIEALEGLIATYHQYFLVPAGTKNNSLTPSISNEFNYVIEGDSVEYFYADYSSTHRVFDLTALDESDVRIIRASGDWWENWDAEGGKTSQGKHYGNLRFEIGDGEESHAEEFSWKDDGGGNYRVQLNIWRPGSNSGIAGRYNYTFNADKSGKSIYREWAENGGGLYYEAEWAADGSGKINIGDANSIQYEWTN